MSSTQQLPRQFGKYVLIRKIAMGGMAEIFKAKTAGAEGFEKDVVIKRILPHFTEDADFVKMFIDEASITSKLQHANIVQIFDFDVCEGSYFIAMELIDGVDLKKVVDVGVKDGKPVSVAQCVQIVMETAKGLHYAHAKEHKGQPLNIVHRDISPHNVMVSYNGEVKLMDFGIAKAAQRSTKTMAGTVKGKVAYMSPEQARGKNLDGRSDLFALGIMLWEMLTGKRLFLGDSDFETLTNVLKSEAPAPSTLNSKVDAQLDAIILKALAKDRDERQKNVEEFTRELTRWYYSTVQDLEAESLKKYLHELFAEDIEENRVLSEEERGRPVSGATSGSSPSAPSFPVHSDQNERTMAMPAADAGAPTLLEGSLSAAQLQNAMRKPNGNDSGAMANQSQATAVFDAASMGHMSAAPERPKAKSKKGLYIALIALLLGGGAVAAIVIGGGDGKTPLTPEKPAPEVVTAPPADEAAELVVTIDPPTARLTLDGKVVGTKVTGLKLGSAVELVGEAPGYVKYSQAIKLEDKATVVNITLEKEREKVSLVIEPEGDDKAEITVDGKVLGTGAQVVNGQKGDVLKVEIKPSKAGAEIVKENVTLDGEEAVHKITVGQIDAKLFLNLDPSGAEVTVSKGTAATTADGNQAVVSGLAVGDTVEVTVSSSGHVSKTDNIAINAAEQTLAIVLTKTKTTTNTPRPTTNTAATGGKGTIVVRATPWANVTIGGRPLGQTPKTIPVDAGTHTIVLSKGSQVVTKTVKVTAGKTSTVSHNFE